ncbi:MAG: alpha/beta fold hydrolase [Pseudomonadota bacterium]
MNNRADIPREPPTDLVEKLLGYAMDTLTFDDLVGAISEYSDYLQHGVNQTTFLTILSSAEALAWQLRADQPAPLDTNNCIFFLLNKQGEVIGQSASTASLTEYCTAQNRILHFADPDSAQKFANALREVREQNTQHVLVELNCEQQQVRYAYLTRAEDLPKALQSSAEAVAYGLLISGAEADEHARLALQSSFGLTTAESNICMHLAHGEQIKEVAAALGVSVNTVRNHLQSVFDKTGINRQSDLLLMVTQLSFILNVIKQAPPSSTPQIAQDTPPYQFVIIPEPFSRKVAYRTYGSGSKKVVYFHESVATSRLPSGMSAKADAMDATIVAIERPGNGFSDAIPNFDFATVAYDVEQVLEHNDIDRVRLLGHMSGAVHALFAAMRMQDRVDKIMLVNGRSPGRIASREDTALDMLRNKLTTFPWLMNSFFNILRNRSNPDNNRRMLLRIYGEQTHDRLFLEENPQVLEHLVVMSEEALTVTASGVADEILCYNENNPIDLSPLKLPITVWHGQLSAVTPYKDLRDALTHNSTMMSLYPDKGAMLMYELWDEVWDEILA